MAATYHINPRIRAYGKARIDITQRAKNEEEWLDGWHESLHPFAFEFKERWKFNIEYKVDDYAAEVGFFIDILGFPVSEFSPSHAQFTTPDQEFTFSVAAALEGEESTNPETLRIQLMVDEIMETCEELEQRGITFEQPPQSLPDGSNLFVGYFRTPHGIPIDLWGFNQDVLEEEINQDDVAEDVDQGMDTTGDWQEPEEEDSEPSPVVDSPQINDLPQNGDHTEGDTIDQEDESLELVYEDEEEPELLNKLIDSFDRFRSSRPLSRFSSPVNRSKQSKDSSSNRLSNRSGYNKEGKNGSSHHIQGNI